MQKITPFLWFDGQAEEAANYYVSIFKNSKITSVNRYDEGTAAATGQQAGSVMTISFHLDGQAFVALNGGPTYKFSPATSFVIDCHDQAEVDYYWERLGEEGTYNRCGWLDDKFGVTWQIVPAALTKWLGDPDPAKANRVMQAMLQMTKIDIAALARTFHPATEK